MKQKAKRGRGLMVILLLAAAAIMAGTGWAAEEPQQKNPPVVIKISGGIGLTLNGGGDLGLYRQGMIDLYNDIGTLDYFKGTSNWKSMSTIPNCELDVIFPVGQNFGIGIGTGYIRASSTGNYGFDYNLTDYPAWGTYTLTATATNAEDFKITAIPVRLSLYVTLPLGHWSFYGYGGVGYYFGKYAHQYRYDFTYNYADSSDIYYNEKQEITNSEVWTENAKRNSLGFHGGLGLEYRIGSSLALGLEVFGRFVTFSNWTGDVTVSSTQRERDWREDLGWYYDQTATDSNKVSGTLWYFESQDSTLGKYYPQLNIGSAPSGDTYRNVRNAAVNLNAFGVAATLKVYFSLF